MFAIAAAIAWSVLGYKILELRRDGNPFLRSYCTTVALMAVSFTVGMPPIIGRLEHATGVLAAWDTCVIVLGCAAVQTTLLLWTYPAGEAWRRIRPRWWLCGLAATAMLILDLVGRVNPNTVDLGANAETPERIYGQTAFVADAMLIYIAVLGSTTFDSTRIFNRYSHLVDRRWLRRCLRGLTVSSLLNFTSCGAAAVFLIGLRFHGDLATAQQAYTALAGLGVMAGAIATAMPTLGPRLDRLVAYHRLYPLWLALYRANPDIVLDPPRWVDRWKPWDVDFRLYRSIVEIRDSRLALRPFMDPVLATDIRAWAERSASTDEDLDATVEAALLAAAIDAKLAGEAQLPTRSPVVKDPHPGSDLASETDWFVCVAQAFVRLTPTGIWRRQPLAAPTM